MMNKKAQDEMVGFAVIVIIVGVIFLIAIGFMINTPDKTVVQDYEIESFIQSSLQYTTDCQNNLGFTSLQETIISCENGEICLDGKSSCEVLNSTLDNIIKKGWNVGSQSAVKGYEFDVQIGEESNLSLSFKDGNQTSNYKSAFQNFARNGVDYTISLNLYS
jgi:hypothetical protein